MRTMMSVSPQEVHVPVEGTPYRGRFPVILQAALSYLPRPVYQQTAPVQTGQRQVNYKSDFQDIHFQGALPFI